MLFSLTGNFFSSAVFPGIRAVSLKKKRKKEKKKERKRAAYCICPASFVF